MRNTLILALALTNLTFANDQEPCVIEAPPIEAPPVENCCIQTYDHRFQIGPNFTYAWVTPDENSTTNGPLGGAQAIYEYRPLDFFYGAIVFDWRQGSTSNSLTSRSIVDVHAQERLGYTFHFPCYWSRLSVFSGLGGRYMSEKVTTGGTSVRFNYAHLYVPVGFLYDYEVACWWNWGLGFQWRPQVYPTVHIVPLDGTRWMLKKRLDNFYVEMPFTFKISECFSCIVNPFFEFWHDGKTFATTTLGLPLNLPSNRYYFVGLDVNVAWEF